MFNARREEERNEKKESRRQSFTTTIAASYVWYVDVFMIIYKTDKPLTKPQSWPYTNSCARCEIYQN